MNKRAPDSIENPSQAFLSNLDFQSTLACLLLYEKRVLSWKDRKTKTLDINPYIHSNPFTYAYQIQINQFHF